MKINFSESNLVVPFINYIRQTYKAKEAEILCGKKQGKNRNEIIYHEGREIFEANGKFL